MTVPLFDTWVSGDEDDLPAPPIGSVGSDVPCSRSPTTLAPTEEGSADMMPMRLDASSEAPCRSLFSVRCPCSPHAARLDDTKSPRSGSADTDSGGPNNPLHRRGWT